LGECLEAAFRPIQGHFSVAGFLISLGNIQKSIGVRQVPALYCHKGFYVSGLFCQIFHYMRYPEPYAVPVRVFIGRSKRFFFFSFFLCQLSVYIESFFAEDF